MFIIKQCDSIIRKLGQCEEIQCTERTIRRTLNEDNGKINPRYLSQIAKYLNIDPRLLTGGNIDMFSDSIPKTIYLSQLTIENYSYFRKRKEELQSEPIKNL